MRWDRDAGHLWDHPWNHGSNSTSAPGAVGDPGRSLFAFGLHLALTETLSLLLETAPAFIRMGIPAASGNFQGPCHTRPLCSGNLGHASIPLILLVS